MRSFIACHIPDRRSRAQIRFDQFVDKRYGYEIKSYLHFLLLEHPPRGLPWHLNLTFPAVPIPHHCTNMVVKCRTIVLDLTVELPTKEEALKLLIKKNFCNDAMRRHNDVNLICWKYISQLPSKKGHKVKKIIKNRKAFYKILPLLNTSMIFNTKAETYCWRHLLWRKDVLLTSFIMVKGNWNHPPSGESWISDFGLNLYRILPKPVQI